MKLTQVAYIPTDEAQQLTELAAIGFDVSKHQTADALTAVFAKLFPDALTDQALQQRQAGIAVSESQNLADFLAQAPQAMSREAFYTAALQLIGFEPLEQFPLATAFDFWQATGLPTVDADLTSAGQVYAATYRLLTTRTPSGLNFIDQLAMNGFYQNYQGPKPLFFNGKAQAVYDPHQVIREVVWVESDLDSDQDGKRDMLAVTINRPQSDKPLPVLFTANPYFHGTNDVTAATHVPSVTLEVKPAGTTSTTPEPFSPVDLPHREVTATTQTAAVTASDAGSYSLDDFFLSRGFAVAYSAGIGTKDSDGVRDTGGPQEVHSAVAVVEWLNHKRQAFTTRTGSVGIDAWWSSGHIAMTGKSYLGTLAIAVAATGVEGLDTIIEEAGISSWYDYYRENGLVVAPGGFQGEDADVLAVDTFSRYKLTGDYLPMKATWAATLKQMAVDQDRHYGSDNAWWQARNYRRHLDQVKASVMIVHGLNDWNVKPANAIRLWHGLQQAGVTTKMFLHQGEHVYLHNVRSLDFTDAANAWLSHYLYGQANGVDASLPNVVAQSNHAPETWETQGDFGHALTRLPLEQFSATSDHFTDNATATFKAQKDTSDGFEKAIVTPDNPYQSSSLWLTLPKQAMKLEGVPRLHLRVKVDQATAILSARLVDLGEAKRLVKTAKVVTPKGYKLGINFNADALVEYGLAKASPSKLITFTHVNVQNQVDAATATTVVPGEWFELTVDFQPTRYQLPEQRQLALVIHGADMAQTQRPTATPSFTFDWANSYIELPIVKE